MKLSYYPGCSLHGTGVEFDVSTREVCRHMDVELVELDDWNCCGATAAHSLNRDLSAAVSARNLAIASRRGMPLAVPCAACYHALKKTDHEMRHDADLADRMRTEFGIDYPGGIDVQHIMHVFATDEMLAAIGEKVTNPLKGLKVGCYYGCLIVRPPEAMGNVDDPENPRKMEAVMEACGAETVDWSYKTDCCGASFALGRPATAMKLIAKIFDNAIKSGIDAIAVACPLCHANLDGRQAEASEILGRKVNMPIFYFTELMGIAMGLAPVKKILSKHLTSVKPALEKLS